jgi:hypothetical protein
MSMEEVRRQTLEAYYGGVDLVRIQSEKLLTLEGNADEIAELHRINTEMAARLERLRVDIFNLYSIVLPSVLQEDESGNRGGVI